MFSALISGSALAATVYKTDDAELKVGGRAEAAFNISDDNESDETSAFKDKSKARVNLVGKTNISDNLYGFGKYESEFTTDSDDTSTINNRYFFAGLGTSFGEFSYGKQDSAQVQVTDFTDMMNTFDEAAADLIDANKDKRKNNFVYSGKFDALSVKANYIASEQKDNNSFGASAVYGFDFGLKLGLGYTSQDQGTLSEDQLNFGVQYKLKALTLGAIYGTGTKVSNDAEVDAEMYELATKYSFGSTTLIAAYNYQQVDSADTKDQIALEVEHKFNSSLRTYAGYMLQQLDNKDNQLQAGIRYDF
ncbi:porin [Vibrio ziniensis]|uniref:Porin n=1 Tax=Vibrio ziniensis TaxID=2711221 RepID=A0A6G7CR29_9VIBR|nr:porin [Vibrio ziniensis]QIH44540.1 porin [Vibrio ziniensis]